MSKINYGQKGYDGQSMSVRATAAYEQGEKPRSKWTKRAMLDEIAEFCECESIDLDVSKMRRDDLFSTYFTWSSWHHTGKFASATDFYSLDGEAVRRDARELTDDEATEREIARKAEAEAERMERERMHADFEKRLEDDRAHGYGWTFHKLLEAGHAEVRKSKKSGNETVYVTDAHGILHTCPLRDADSICVYDRVF